MHAKTDSEVTSLAPSSPAHSPPRRGGAAAGTIPPPPGPAPARAVYYVQSPSRDSHDGEKTATSLHSTPAASPPHYAHSSVGRHSRESSSTSRFSGSLKPHGPASAAAAAAGSRRVSPNDASAAAAAAGADRWKDGGVIEEEGLLDEEGERRGIPRRCYVLGFVTAFLVLFFFFALILWGASHNQKPIVIMTSIRFENFIIQAGTDASLVPTELSTLNTTVKLTFRNTGRFFGVHVSSTPLDIYYSQIKMASGYLFDLMYLNSTAIMFNWCEWVDGSQMNEFYQSRKSQRSVSVVVLGNKVPLYGGGAGLSSSPAAAAAASGKAAAASPPIPLTLSLRTRARAYVLGELVKPTFYTDVQCSVLLDQSKLNTPVSLKNTCQYNS
ncbi:hypothetical protein ACMD2_06113 [Ananas comosus]|uniref:Late embryogenesis abundant protein LEA-2 subgroup domain-containing protein n=1 Tax=Ananas comosus TaxID=4615 RepID=A0A199VQB5_ANACO|nr:hypothetical protein ACMD2_06113 [Ananas comosus]